MTKTVQPEAEMAQPVAERTQSMAERAQPMAEEDRLQDVQRDNPPELVELPMATKRATIEVIMQKWKYNAPLSQESNGEGSTV